MSDKPSTEHDWYLFLTEGENLPRFARHLLGLLPSNPRCKICNSPFKGWGGFVMHLMGKDQSRYNPRFCQQCDRFEHPGGAVGELTMFFADVRGSTQLAEQLGAHEFSRLINRFYLTATYVLSRSNTFVDRLIGDEAIGLYVPSVAGAYHPRRAIEAREATVTAAATGRAGTCRWPR